MIKISTSILSSNDRIAAIKKLNSTDTDYLHIDVMDGKFVQNTQFSLSEVNNLIPYSNKPVDIHLMTENPDIYIDSLNHPSIEFITIHVEIEQDIKSIIDKIKLKGYKVGLSLKPSTNLSMINQYLNDIDMVLVMSVEPGFGGQSFIDSTVDRLKEIKQLKDDLIIEVDGGIKDHNIELIKPYADIAVVGSYIVNSNNYNEAINNLKK